MRAAALACILLLAGCSSPEQTDDAPTWSGDFHAAAHNNSTLPGRFEFRLEQDGTTLIAQTRQVAGGASTEWTHAMQGERPYHYRMTFSALTGGGAAVHGTIEARHCPVGDLVLGFEGRFLPDGRPVVGGAASLDCQVPSTAASA